MLNAIAIGFYHAAGWTAFSAIVAYGSPMPWHFTLIPGVCFGLAALIQEANKNRRPDSAHYPPDLSSGPPSDTAIRPPALGPSDVSIPPNEEARDPFQTRTEEDRFDTPPEGSGRHRPPRYGA